MLRLRLKIPHHIRTEALYVLQWTLAERLGLTIEDTGAHEQNFIEIAVPGSPQILRSPCIAGWQPMRASHPPQFAGIPKLSFVPLAELSKGASLPVLFGAAEAPSDGESRTLSFDLFGTIFWHLARVEELETDERDQFNVYNGRQSFAHRNGILQRAVVDEYIDYFWQQIKSLWPGAERPVRAPDTFVTCDVDVPFSHSLSGWRAAARTLAADLLVRRSPRVAAQTMHNLWQVKTKGDYSLDPFNSFAWYMDQCETAGRRAAFYFICGNPAPEIDNRYELTHPVIRQALTDIAMRGHEIGMHASYTTFGDAAQIERELANLRSTCRELGIDQPLPGNRQHYLRWDWQHTPDILADAGFTYDSTLGYNDMPGFRCGTCHEFPLWSWQKGRPLALRERPLIAMAGALVGPSGLNLTHEQAREMLASLKEVCRQHSGTFVCLWHNNEFRMGADRALFNYAIS
jgi:hypothetical protein